MVSGGRLVSPLGWRLPVSLTRLHQGVCVSLMYFDRYGESRVCVSLVRFSCQSPVCIPRQVLLERFFSDVL